MPAPRPRRRRRAQPPARKDRSGRQVGPLRLRWSRRPARWPRPFEWSRRTPAGHRRTRSRDPRTRVGSWRQRCHGHWRASLRDRPRLPHRAGRAKKRIPRSSWPVLRTRAIRAASPNPRPTDWGPRRRQDGRAIAGRLPRALGFPRISRCVDWVAPLCLVEAPSALANQQLRVTSGARRRSATFKSERERFDRRRSQFDPLLSSTDPQSVHGIRLKPPAAAVATSGLTFSDWIPKKKAPLEAVG